jgi:hypothetical protein
MLHRLLPLAVGVCAFVVLVAATAGPVSAAPTLLNLHDLNSDVQFNSDTGVMSWAVDTVQQLKQQWFYYRLDGMTQELPLSGLGYVKGKSSNADYDDGDETLTAVYGNEAGLSITLTYVLSGGLLGSHQSDLQETIAFTNKTGQAVRLQFFQYCDFDLNGTAGDDTVQLVNANTVRQSDGSMMVAETVVTPAPLHTEVGVYDQNMVNPGATLVKLTDTNADNLNDSTGPVGPADVTWAFQWDVTVAPNSTVQISKDKNIVPEPATVGLMGMGIAVAVAARVRKLRRQAA